MTNKTTIIDGKECDLIPFEQFKAMNKEDGLDTVLLPEYNLAVIFIVVPEIKHLETHGVIPLDNGLIAVTKDTKTHREKLRNEVAKLKLILKTKHKIREALDKGGDMSQVIKDTTKELEKLTATKH